MQDVLIATFATDGIDGPTDAAGAVVTGETVQLARKINLSATDCLSRNDSYTFFSRVETLIKTGPTGTNVNDLAIILVYPLE